MDVRFNSISLKQVPFRGEVTANATPAVRVKDVDDNDTITKSSDEPKTEKRGPVHGFKNFVSICRKFCVDATTYTGGALGGAFKGATIGFATYGSIALVKFMRTTEKKAGKAAKKAGIDNTKEAASIIKKGIDARKPGKVAIAASILTGATAFVFSLYKASLDASEKKAAIDHRYGTGHNSK